MIPRKWNIGIGILVVVLAIVNTITAYGIENNIAMLGWIVAAAGYSGMAVANYELSLKE